MSSERVSVDVNLAQFRNALVVDDYLNMTGERDCEAFLFATYIRPDSDVLDLGVGAGRTAALLAPRAGSYLGIDYSQEMINAARRKLPQFRFAVMDAADMSSLPDKSFDVIFFSFNGLSYLFPDRKRIACIRECRRLLRRGGFFIFSLHSAHSLFIRPSRTSPTIVGAVKGLFLSLRDNARRFFQRILTSAFWRGHGYIITVWGSERWTTFAASRTYVRREVTASGFDFVADYGEQYPNRNLGLLTRWNYYVFQKGDTFVRL